MKTRKQLEQELEAANNDLDYYKEAIFDLSLEVGKWIEIKEGCKLPDYDEYVLWAFEDGTCSWDALDKDGSPWLLGGEWEGSEGFPSAKATHYRKIMTPSQVDETFNIK